MEHEDATDNESDGSICHEETLEALTISFFSSQKDPKKGGLDNIFPSVESFNGFLSYPFYRLMNTKPVKIEQSSSKILQKKTNIYLSIHDHSSIDEVHVLVLDFLTRILEEGDNLCFSNGQRNICSNHLLRNCVRQNARPASRQRRSSGLNFRPNLGQYVFAHKKLHKKSVRLLIACKTAFQSQTNREEISHVWPSLLTATVETFTWKCRGSRSS